MKELKSLRKTLFWEVDPETLDEERDAEFIIGRVLDFGDLEDWRAVRDLYGYSKIKGVAKKHVFSERKSANFWSLILKVPPEEIKCTRNRLLKTPKAFLKR